VTRIVERVNGRMLGTEDMRRKWNLHNLATSCLSFINRALAQVSCFEKERNGLGGELVK